MKHILCDIIPSSLSFNNQVSVFFTSENHIIDWKMSDHFMSWELPCQHLNHQAQSHRHDFIWQFPPDNTIPVHPQTISSKFFNSFLS